MILGLLLLILLCNSILSIISSIISIREKNKYTKMLISDKMAGMGSVVPRMMYIKNLRRYKILKIKKILSMINKKLLYAIPIGLLIFLTPLLIGCPVLMVVSWIPALIAIAKLLGTIE